MGSECSAHRRRTLGRAKDESLYGGMAAFAGRGVKMTRTGARRMVWMGVLWVAAAVVAGGVCTAQDEPLIAGIRVEGNDYISAEAIVAEVADVLKIGAPFTAKAREDARRKILKLGYFDDVSVTGEQLAKGVTAVITVVEKKRVTQVLLVGNTVISDDKLREAIFIRDGHVIDNTAIRRDVGRIEDYYSQHGYLAHVSDVQVTKFGVVTFVIEEARIESVVIEGLVRTKESVVRREIELQPGELFQEQKIIQQVRRIFNVGVFENVTSDIRPGVKDPERGVIVAMRVEEKRTGQASVAVGYSNLDDFVLVLSLAENNFRGRAERASIDLELFGRTSYETKFYEPYLDKKGTSFSIRIFDTERRRRFVGGASVTTSEDIFDERRTGVNMSVSVPTTKTSRTSFGFRSEEVSSSFLQGTRIIGGGTATPGIGEGGASGSWSSDDASGGGSSYDPGALTDSPAPGDLTGPIVVAAPLHPGGRLASLTIGHSVDTRNIRTKPTAGSYTDLSVEYAGKAVGGEVEFQKLTGERRLYKRVASRGDVLAARLMLGTSFGDMPLFESYSVGGVNTLRGYEEDRYRGEKMALLNVEYRRPLSDKLQVVGFVDVGSAYGGEFPTVMPGFSIPAEDTEFESHVGVGIGLRVDTPIGPIRLDFGFGEDGSQAHFSFGQMF